MTSYCIAAHSHPLHLAYHNTEYGFPCRDDAMLFGRLVLEINQAGLNWLTMLKKKENFQRAFDNFDIDRIALYDESDHRRLMADAGIIRNRLKIVAVIENARRVQAIREQYGSFAAWLDAHHPLSLKEWQKLFKKTFRFTGGEIVREFLTSLGYLEGAHDQSCPIYTQIALLKPPWLVTVAS